METTIIDYSVLIFNILLYAELHYKFKWIGSRYFQKEPEILADLPYRVEPDKKIPILLLIKDSNQFPILLDFVSVDIFQLNNKVLSKKYTFKETLNTHWWNKTLYVEKNNIKGNIDIEVSFFYIINGKKKKCITHNYPQAHTNKLNTYISNYKFPRCSKTYYGDLHYHTNLTEDMVEFGAPLDSTAITAEALGVDFFCNTDHSYDLDDKIGSWTETDPDLIKWNKSRDEIKNINNDPAYTSLIIPSEELSLHNYKGKNIHALILNNNIFLPGEGDGAEKPFNFKSTYNTNTVFEKIEKNALCIPAHPFNRVPSLQQFFFKRGVWENKDINSNKIPGFQILNGEYDSNFINSMNIWINLLLKGVKKYIYAGNDAHGNFNIYRQIKTPMLTLSEKKAQMFGYYRTGVFSENLNINSIIKSMKSGSCFITNGPYLKFSTSIKSKQYMSGSVIRNNTAEIHLHAISSPEFGLIKKIIIIKGIIGEAHEEVCLVIKPNNKYECKLDYNIFIENKCYYRTRIDVISKKTPIFALSNPIWYENIKKK